MEGELSMAVVFKKPHALKDVPLHYCPGCTHGIVHRLIAEVIDELGIEGKTVGVSPVGCTYNNYEYFNCDMVQAAHGRAPAVATGIKRVNPDNVVFAYQGDGDLAAIGTAEIVHAATRGEKISTIFVNNAIYGMTSGQMAPTSLIGQVTTTTPFGRKPEIHGYPVKVCELLSTLQGAVYVERVSLHDIKNILNAKRAIKKAFQVQMAGKGFSIVEVLSSCPTNWGINPAEALKWIEEKMVPFYPLGNFKGKDLEV
jgi:2-oxoglutarate ferredoxin oxidoreductase subunit beta